VEIHEMDVISIIKRIKAKEDQDFCLCGGPEKSRFKWLHKVLF